MAPELSRQSLRAHLDGLLAGVDLDSIPRDSLAEGLHGAAIASAKLLLPTLLKEAAAVADTERQSWTAESESLRELWGRAFDLFLGLVLGAEEAFELVTTEEMADRQSDPLAIVTAHLSAAGIRLGWEVHQLVCAGLGEGAAGRARTLHETAVTAWFLLVHDRDGELAQRLIDHEVMRQAYWAESRAAAVKARGEPLPAADLEELGSLMAAKAEMLARYGPGFQGLYGWADGYLEGRLDFTSLEQAAGLAHMRPTYIVNSLRVHPSWLGLRLASADTLRVRSRGSSVGLGDAINSAAVSLVHLAIAVLTQFPEDPSPLDAIFVETLVGLCEAAQAESVAAETEAQKQWQEEHID